MTAEIERSGRDELFATAAERPAQAPALARYARADAADSPPSGTSSCAPCCARTRRSTCTRRCGPTRLGTSPSMPSLHVSCGRSPTDRHLLPRGHLPLDGTVSQLRRHDAGALIAGQGHGVHAATACWRRRGLAERYPGGSFACLYLAPYNYHRVHVPLRRLLRATRYVPGQLFSVNAEPHAVPDLFARNERVICDLDTADGPMCLVMVGALFVGSIKTVFAGRINPPPGRGGQVRLIHRVGRTFWRGDELGRFNMGSTVIVLYRRRRDLRTARRARRAGAMGQPLARFGARRPALTQTPRWRPTAAWKRCNCAPTCWRGSPIREPARSKSNARPLGAAVTDVHLKSLRVA